MSQFTGQSDGLLAFSFNFNSEFQILFLLQMIDFQVLYGGFFKKTKKRAFGVFLNFSNFLQQVPKQTLFFFTRVSSTHSDF